MLINAFLLNSKVTFRFKRNLIRVEANLNFDIKNSDYKLAQFRSIIYTYILWIFTFYPYKAFIQIIWIYFKYLFNDLFKL